MLSKRQKLYRILANITIRSTYLYPKSVQQKSKHFLKQRSAIDPGGGQRVICVFEGSHISISNQEIKDITSGPN